MAHATMPVCQCREGIYEIDEFGCTEIFVIEGRDRALVIDTGTGIGDLKGFIETKITQKPYIIAASHNHVDHIGGAGWFEEIYMNPADIGHTDPFFPPTLEFRRNYAKTVNGELPEGGLYGVSDIRPWQIQPAFLPMEDGQVFELGGRRVTAWHCPGHTAGEMVFLDDRTRTLLCGDAFNCNLLFNCSQIGDSHENARVTLEAMQRIYDRRGLYDAVFNSHHDFREFGKPLADNVIPNLIRCMEKMLNRTAELKDIPDALNPGKTKTVAACENVFITLMGENIREF